MKLTIEELFPKRPARQKTSTSVNVWPVLWHGTAGERLLCVKGSIEAAQRYIDKHVDSTSATGEAYIGERQVTTVEVEVDVEIDNPTLHEVICFESEGRAFGATFTEAETASAFGAAMKRRGFTVEPSPAFEPYRTADEAVEVALSVLETKGRCND